VRSTIIINVNIKSAANPSPINSTRRKKTMFASIGLLNQPLIKRINALHRTHLPSVGNTMTSIGRDPEETWHVSTNNGQATTARITKNDTGLEIAPNRPKHSSISHLSKKK
jgi:hypothetical protein